MYFFQKGNCQERFRWEKQPTTIGGESRIETFYNAAVMWGEGGWGHDVQPSPHAD